MKSRRFISIFLCVTLLLTLPAPAALANGWGLKRGLILNAVSKTHDYDEYSALAQLKVQDGEVAVFAWIVYASRAERDRINALVMKDPRIACDPENMPFDAQRMFWGGFTGLVEAGWGAAPPG